MVFNFFYFIIKLGHNHEVTIAKYGNNDHVIFTGSVDRTVRIWDTRTSNSSVNICHAHDKF